MLRKLESRVIRDCRLQLFGRILHKNNTMDASYKNTGYTNMPCIRTSSCSRGCSYNRHHLYICRYPVSNIELAHYSINKFFTTR